MTFLRVDASALPRLRGWLDGLRARGEELAESYRRQQTLHELFYLLDGADGPVLAIISESADLQEGAKEFLRSELAIDVEFKSLIQEAGFAEPSARLLFDSRDLLPDQAAAVLRAGSDAGAIEED